MPIKLITVDEKERGLLTYVSITHAFNDAWHLLYPSLLFLIALDYPNFFFLGVLANVVIASRAITAILAGILADRYSNRVLFAACAVLSALGSLLVGISQDEVSLALALFILGVGIGIYHPVGMATIARNIRQRATALGIHEAAGILGYGLIPVVLVSVGIAFGWKTAFLIAAGASLVPMALLFLVPKQFDRPRLVKSEDNVPASRLLSTLTERRVLGVYMTSAFMETAQNGFTTFLPAAIAVIGGLGEGRVAGLSTTGLFLGLTILVGIPGSLIGGRLGDRFSPHRALAVLSLLPIPLLLFMGATEGAAWLALASLVRIPFNATSPLINALVAKNLPPGIHGKAFALSYSLGPIVSSLVALLAGAIIQAYGLPWVFPLMAVFLVGAFLSARFVLRPARGASSGSPMPGQQP
ncbi:MAG: MFS transporter [SAR202 cluster bacterium]|nr:MFS transporter [SAR202 cluster bacterium]